MNQHRSGFSGSGTPLLRVGQSDSAALPSGMIATLLLTNTMVIIVLVSLSMLLPAFQAASVFIASALWIAIASLMWRHIDKHDHKEFGAANIVTTLRGAVISVLAGLIPIASQITSEYWLWVIAVVATITLCMDGLDGYLARRSGLCSDFGARLDMETDALLALVITLVLWQSEKVGVWVLGLGLMRYAFLGSSYFIHALKADLFPSMRRKSVCVVQVGALCLMLCPLLSSTQATAVGLIALVALTYSFAVDVWWLLLRRPQTSLARHEQQQPR